jgi:hypothetical protein
VGDALVWNGRFGCVKETWKGRVIGMNGHGVDKDEWSEKR